MILKNVYFFVGSMDCDAQSEAGDFELEFEVCTPRLQTPFYERLRKKYPKVRF